MKEWLPKGGVKELLKSPSGRQYLSRLQERHKLDCLQPCQVGFDKRWGNGLKQKKEQEQKREKMSRDEWAMTKEKKEYDEKRKTFSTNKRYYEV